MKDMPLYSLTRSLKKMFVKVVKNFFFSNQFNLCRVHIVRHRPTLILKPGTVDLSERTYWFEKSID